MLSSSDVIAFTRILKLDNTLVRIYQPQFSSIGGDLNILTYTEIILNSTISARLFDWTIGAEPSTPRWLSVCRSNALCTGLVQGSCRAPCNNNVVGCTSGGSSSISVLISVGGTSCSNGASLDGTYALSTSNNNPNNLPPNVNTFGGSSNDTLAIALGVAIPLTVLIGVGVALLVYFYHKKTVSMREQQFAEKMKQKEMSKSTLHDAQAL